VHTVDKIFEGIRSVTTRIYKGLVIIEKGCANLTWFMGILGGQKHSQAAYNWLWGHPRWSTKAATYDLGAQRVVAGTVRRLKRIPTSM
jgi:hypothetical protein